MLEKVFLQIINMSYLGGIVILFLIPIRLILKKAPKRYSYLLWSIALIRLTIPISLESPLSLIPVNPNPFTNDSVINTQNVNQLINSSILHESVVNSVNPAQVWISIGTIIWITGMSLFIIHAGLALNGMSKQLKEASYMRNNIYTLSTTKTPFVLGLFKPRIYLPDGVSDSEVRYILRHEEMHIQRHDHIVKFISYLVLSVHWCNPLVWVAYHLSGQDMEMSCDESVITQLGHGIKPDYAQSLLNYTTGTTSFRMMPLAFGEGHTKGRIKNVLNFRQPKFYIIFITIVAVILISIGLLFNPSNGDHDANAISVQEAAQAVDQIVAVIESEKVVTNGIEYDILVSNESDYSIYKIRLALSYPLKIANGSRSNKDRVYAERMVEHLESGSFEVVKVFVPATYSSKDILDVESLEVNLDGYLNEVNEQNKFSLSGAVKNKEASN